MNKETNRSVLVTGASGGIGAAIAQAFAAEGYKVGVHCNSNRHGAEETMRGMQGDGHVLLQYDISDTSAVREMIEQATSMLGGLYVLVNNAGIFEPTPFDTPDYEDWLAGWKRTLDTNLLSAANATYCALKIMRAAGGGKIINIASRSAFRAETEAIPYAVSKAGMVNLTRCLARAEAKNGILSYCVAPGWVETAMARPEMDKPEVLADILSQIPLGRVASVDDVAGVVTFLASSAADYLSGITVPVNGASYFH